MKTFKRFFRNPGTTVGFVLVVLLFLIAVLGPFLAGDPNAQNLSVRLEAPSFEHWFGTDSLGRDVYSRVIHGTRISLRLGFFVVVLAITVGSAVGLFAALLGGIWDDILMRITDIFLAFPALILAMAIAAALGRSLTNVMIAVAAVSWPIYARLMRAQVLGLRNLEFVEAARALGAGMPRVAWRHLLPNSLSPALIQASFDIGGAILTAAGLSFIGFGAQPPTPEWGAMVSDTRNFIKEAPWASTFPALAILVTVMAFNLLGDGLRDVLDPRDYS
ncbi:ABC transporter permease [soil metagenome]